MSAPPDSALIALVREIGRTHVAPHAAEVDRDARFPREAFAALKSARLLSAYVPTEYGGMGLSVTELAKVCEVLGHYDSATAMVYAMHQIQVACIVHHALHTPFFQAFAREMVERQLLLASATTEVGIGGDVRTSSCAVEAEGGQFRLEKKAPVISYALNSDVILVTARRAPDAGPHDQVHVLVRRDQCELEPISTWDTLGFRGTCSSGYVIRAQGALEQVLPASYAEIHAKSMHSFAHCTWGALWLGIASDAVAHARSWVRAEARKTPGTLPPTALRLAELDTELFTMRAGVESTLAAYEARLAEYPTEPFPQDFNYAIRVNNLKITASRQLIDIVGGALSICGIAAYRNDTKFSLGRHLRDAHGASLMVHNDRILGQSSSMQIMLRDY